MSATPPLPLGQPEETVTQPSMNGTRAIEAFREKLKIAFGIAAGVLVLAVATYHLLQKAGPDSGRQEPGEHRYVFTGESSIKVVGNNTLHLYSLKQAGWFFHPTHSVLRSIAPTDMNRCEVDTPPSSGDETTLTTINGTQKLKEIGSGCVWQENTADFEKKLAATQHATAGLKSLLARGHFTEFNQTVNDGAEIGDIGAMSIYIIAQAFSSGSAPPDSRNQYGAVSLDPDRAEMYWKALSRSDPPPHDRDFLGGILGKWFVGEGERLINWDTDGNFPRSMDWFVRAGDVGSIDGMVYYLQGCNMQRLLSKFSGSPFAPGYSTDPKREARYFNTLLGMEKSGNLDAWQLKHFGPIEKGWSSPASNQPHEQQNDAPQPNSQNAEEVTVVRTEKEIDSSSYWTPRLFVRNNSSHEVTNVSVPVTTYDASGVMQSDGSALFSSIPAHTTAESNCCLNMITGNPTVKVGTPTYQ